MAKEKLPSGMSCKQIQSYCDEKIKPTAKDEIIEACDVRSEILILIANLAARIQENG